MVEAEHMNRTLDALFPCKRGKKGAQGLIPDHCPETIGLCCTTVSSPLAEGWRLCILSLSVLAA